MGGWSELRYVLRAQQRLDDTVRAIAQREPDVALRQLTSALWCVSAAAAELVAWQRALGVTWAEIADSAGTDVHEAMRCWAVPARGILRESDLGHRRKLKALAKRERRVLAGQG